MTGNGGFLMFKRKFGVAYLPPAKNPRPAETSWERYFEETLAKALRWISAKHWL